jgi:site-specific recombinase XerC
MRELEYKYDNNILKIDSSDITVEQYLNNWFETYCLNNLKLTTYTGYRQHIDNYICPRIGHMKIVDLRPIEVQTMYCELLKNGRMNGKKPLNPKTVIQTYRILRKALKNAVMLQIIEKNPCDYVETPKKKNL